MDLINVRNVVNQLENNPSPIEQVIDSIASGMFFCQIYTNVLEFLEDQKDFFYKEYLDAGYRLSAIDQMWASLEEAIGEQLLPEQEEIIDEVYAGCSCGGIWD